MYYSKKIVKVQIENLMTGEIIEILTEKFKCLDKAREIGSKRWRVTFEDIKVDVRSNV